MLGLSWKQLLVQTILLLLFWLLLAGGEVGAEAWVVALPTLVVAITISLHLKRPHRQRLRWHLLPAFFMSLLLEMFRGAVQTARMAISPAKRLRPGLVSMPLELGGTSERTLLINILNLVPGTLSVSLTDNTLLLHVLDTTADVADEVVRLQRSVDALFIDEEGE